MSTFTKHEHGAWCHPSADGCPDEIPAAPLTADERARVAAFNAAPVLAESSEMTRAMLALAEELDGEANALDDGDWLGQEYGTHPVTVRYDTANLIRTTLAAVLAADPEPRGEVVERMARAMWAARKTEDPWSWLNEEAQDYYRRLAAAALDASRGGTQ